MGERNIILGIAVFIFVALTATFGGIAFCYKLEGDSLAVRMALEKQRKDKVVFKIMDPDVGIQKKIDKVKDSDIESAKKVVDDPTDGLLVKIKDTKGAGEQSLQLASAAHAKRKAADAKRKASTDEAVKSLGTAYNDMVGSLKKLEDELKGHENDLKKIQEELLTVMSSERGKTEKARDQVLAIKAKVATLETKLERMRERSRRLEELQKDGTVLSADTKTNLAVVDIGKRHGVRPGMVFDIFEVRRNGKKVRKGKLRLTRVESQQSFAVVLAAQESPKICPQCGWSTTDITHLFCPYCLGGEDEKELEAQRLARGSTKDRVVAPEFLNPVKKGDFVSSPFYLGRLKKKAFVFAVIGRTVDRSTQEISMFLKENGCSLVPKVSLDTDFAIIGVGPEVAAQMEMARKMGVSVIRESELFDFFGKTGVSANAVGREDAEGGK